METTEVVINIAISLSATLVGAFLISKYSTFKKKRIKSKIEELDLEERYLEKISKGNTHLLRSSFRILFMYLSLFGVSTGVILACIALKPSDFFIYCALMFGSASIFAGGLVAFYHAKTLKQINNLPLAKEAIQIQRENSQANCELCITIRSTIAHFVRWTSKNCALGRPLA